MFKEYDQKQESLISVAIKDFLWKSHESVLLNDVIDSLDLTILYSTYKNNNWWTSAFHPKMLLKIIFYAYMTQTFSSRWIAKKLTSDLGYMYLAANNKPDFRTINRFRGERLFVVKDIFKQIVDILRKLWVVWFWTVSLDGTKIYANAGVSNNHTEDWLDKMIDKLLKEAQELDEKEDKIFWDKQDNIPEELADPEIRKKKIQDLLDETKKKKEFVSKEMVEKKENGIKQKKINTTDKDSRMMMMKHHDFANWYNMQIITENQVVLTTSISNNPCDVKELIPTIEKLKNEYNKLPKILLADAWYSSWDNYGYLENRGIDWYIPPHCDLQINLNNYEYDKKNDFYKDKDGNIYKLKQYVGLIWRWRPKKWERLKIWEYKSKLYRTTLSDWKTKFLEISEKWHKYHKIYKDKFNTKEGKKIISKRKVDVETVFGNIKHNLKFSRFSLRWFNKASIERDIVCIAHNFKKIFWLSII
jgi:transposase